MADSNYAEMNGSQWLTLAEACQVLGVSDRTIRRRIDREEIPSRLESGRRLVQVHMTDTRQTDDELMADKLTQRLFDEIDSLRQQLADKDRQVADKDRRIEQLQVDFTERIRQLTQELSEARQSSDEASRRHDTIILQMTQQLKQTQMQLEDLRHRPSWWRRLFGAHG